MLGLAVLAGLAGCIWEGPAVFTPLLGPTVKSNPTVAVGATQFLTINSSRLGNVYAKNSMALLATLSAETITGCPSGYDGCSVYRARYDVGSGRWMVLTFGNEDLDASPVPVSHFYLGVSEGTDLTTTTWTQFVFAMPASWFTSGPSSVALNATGKSARPVRRRDSGGRTPLVKGNGQSGGAASVSRRPLR
jgi:hypothetical protein